MGNSGSSVPSTSSSTHVAKKVFYNDWTITDFSLHQKNVLTSATFSSDGAFSMKWYYKLYKNATYDFKGEDILLEAVVISCGSENQLYGIVEIQMPVAVLDRMGTFKTSGPIRLGRVLGNEQLRISQEALTFIGPKRFTTDTLNLSIKMTIVKELRSIGGCGTIIEPPSKLAVDMGNLFENHKFCDIVIAVGAKEFQGHRAILSARSPVFAAMLNNDMTEAQQQRVEIKDIKPEVFNELLRFIYTEEARNLKQNAHLLLPLADKYALDKLKVKCEISLYENLSVESAISTLVLADLHRSEQLKKATIDFICRNTEMLSSPEWIKVMANYPELSAQTMSELMKELAF